MTDSHSHRRPVRADTIGIACAIAALLAWLGPALDGAATADGWPALADHARTHATPAALADAQAAAQRRARFEAAAAAMCRAQHGPQADWAELPAEPGTAHGPVQCVTRTGPRGIITIAHRGAQ